MHDTAMDFGRRFFEAYNRACKNILEVGSMNVNGSLRSVSPPGAIWTGVDFAIGRDVDVVLEDPYKLPFAPGTFDCCVCSSVLEHSEFFWLLFMEMLRCLKPDGLLYVNVPSNGTFHRYPVDCWRFYPDAAMALQRWANRQGVDCVALEWFIGRRQREVYNDFVAIFLHDGKHRELYPKRILNAYKPVDSNNW